MTSSAQDATLLHHLFTLCDRRPEALPELVERLTDEAGLSNSDQLMVGALVRAIGWAQHRAGGRPGERGVDAARYTWLALSLTWGEGAEERQRDQISAVTEAIHGGRS